MIRRLDKINNNNFKELRKEIGFLIFLPISSEVNIISSKINKNLGVFFFIPYIVLVGGI